MEAVKVGIVGCGNISGIYFKNLCERFTMLKVVACADKDATRAREASADYSGVETLSVDDLMARPDIDIVLNLTTPKAHFAVSMQAVEAGKSIYCEKPITLNRRQAQQLLATARRRKVLVGNAPDTFLGAGIQTCRKLIDEGWIGTPVAATAFMTSRGHESWHPDPEFYYQPGGGPMFDMGPYYLTALVNLLGPIRKVSGSARISMPERIITSAKKYGTRIAVEVPTHVAGTLDFANGAVCSIITSFDVWGANLPHIEIHGTHGSLSVPNPNTFGGPVAVKRAGAKTFKEIPLTHPYETNSRGLGVADMACALRHRRSLRASGELAAHILDCMHAFNDSSEAEAHIRLASTCCQPCPMPMNQLPGQPFD